MEKKKTKYFKWRGMVTFLLVLSLLVDTVSGIILYVTPSGRIANWTNWNFWGLSKGEWQAIHIIFSLVLLFIIFGHLYFNWRVLVHFFWSKLRQALNLKKELGVACVITLILFLGTLWNVTPFSSIVGFRQTMKYSGEQGRGAGRRAVFDRRALSHPSPIDLQKWGGHEETLRANAFGQNPYAGRGNGLGRRAYARTIGSTQDTGTLPATLKGRDFVRLGQLETLTGILVKLGDEWGLKVEDTVYEIHMGPREYWDYKGFAPVDGEEARVKGFVYKTDISVATIESGGRSITLRDETGRPAWAGSTFSRGGGRGEQ